MGFASRMYPKGIDTEGQKPRASPGNLDSITGEQIMEVLANLNRQGKTIIMVTHEPNIAAYADSRLHMIDGVVDRIEVSSDETN